MLEALGEKLCAVLTAAGIPARCGYPAAATAAAEAVYLSLRQAETPEGGAARYLGLRQTDGQEPQEVYGLRCQVTLALEVCVPLGTAQAPTRAAALLHSAVEALADGTLRLERLRREAPAADRAAGVLRLPATAEGGVLLLFQTAEGDQPRFEDFVLRGELKE